MRGQNELREPAVNTVPPGKPPKKTTIRLGEVLVYRAGSSKLVLRHPLIESPIVVGRDERAQIQLDHETVSRNHAELVCGPFGHWWIHDLHSTNGTYVNGTLVQDRMLNPRDEIRVGRYTLFIRMPDQPERVPALPTPAPQPRFDAEMTMVMPAPQRAPKISVKHIEHTMELRRKLMATEDPSKRLTTLCEFLVGEAIPATAATVVRIAGADTLTHLCEPVQRSGTSSMAELSQSVITSGRPAAIASMGVRPKVS